MAVCYPQVVVVPEQLPLFVDERDAQDAPDPRTLAARQRARILAGVHPLAYGGRTVDLHPGAVRVIADDGRGGDALRCGSCRFRQPLGEVHRRHRCVVGVRVEPVPAALRLPGGPTTRAILPRVTGAAASVVLPWWPACTDYGAAAP